jgi:CelD/BcsL family acetyltransferase involved in cellulose biosynthesis
MPIAIRDDADAAAVTAYVRAHAAGTPFHLPAWLDAIGRATGNRAHMLAAERGGRIVGVLPLTFMRSMLFGKAMVSSGFAVGGGPIGDDAGVVAALLDAGWALAEK